MRYLITGGAGFIGSHLAWSLASRGETVRLLDNFDTGSRETAHALIRSFPRHVSIVEGDIRSQDVCREACEEADFVLHHAAMASVPRSVEDPVECAAINIDGTVTLLAAARSSGSVRRMIFASSSAVYGDLPGRRKRESDRLDPLSPYASSKLAGEQFCRNYARLLGLQTTSFRYFNVYGERQNPNGAYAAVIPKFLQAVSEHKTPVIYGDGRQVRDFVYVGDVVRANLLACEADESRVNGEVFNVASGSGVSLIQLLKEMSAVVGRPISARREPPRLGDICRSVADVTRARELLGFEPSVGIREGMERMIATHPGFARKK